MGEFSLTHLLIFAFIAMLFFGTSRIEGLGRSLGRSIRGFKEGMNEIDADVKPVKDAADPNRQIRSESPGATAQSQTTSVGEKNSQHS